MKQYTYPSMEIALFNNEDVATTASEATMDALNDWKANVPGENTDARMVDFQKTLQFVL